MVTKENEAARFNDNKVMFSYIDFRMFDNMHKYFNHLQNINKSADLINNIIKTLSTIVAEDSRESHEIYVPMLQAAGYKLTLNLLGFRFHESPVYDLRAFEDMARVLEYGAKKYSKNNWKKGYLNKFSAVDSVYRHLREIIIGEALDEESGLPHMGHIMCNIMFITNDLLIVDRKEV